MRKLLFMLGVMLCSASVFALNAEAPATKDCNQLKADFEKVVNAMDNKSFILQHIIINLADPLKNLTDEQAAPLAQCYATFRVKELFMTHFVRDNADMFRTTQVQETAARYGQAEAQKVAKVYDDLQTEILDFAGRVEALSEKAEFDAMAKQPNNYFIAQNIQINYADPFAKLTDAQAASKAKVYATFQVKGEPMLSFVQRQASSYDEFESLQDFAYRVGELAK